MAHQYFIKTLLITMSITVMKGSAPFASANILTIFGMTNVKRNESTTMLTPIIRMGKSWRSVSSLSLCLDVPKNRQA